QVKRDVTHNDGVTARSFPDNSLELFAGFDFSPETILVFCCLCGCLHGSFPKMQRTTTASLQRLNLDSIMAHPANSRCAATWSLHLLRRTHEVPTRDAGGLSKYPPTYSLARLVFSAHTLQVHPAIPSNDLPIAGCRRQRYRSLGYDRIRLPIEKLEPDRSQRQNREFVTHRR